MEWYIHLSTNVNNLVIEVVCMYMYSICTCMYIVHVILYVVRNAEGGEGEGVKKQLLMKTSTSSSWCCRYWLFIIGCSYM